MNKLTFLTIALGLVAFVSASCPNSCSGHGRCGRYDKCSCFYRWTGPDCSQRLCKEGLAWVDGSQADAHSWAECSNKGICDRETGECVCYDQYDGAACERSVCPNDCSGHGQCEYIHELSDHDSTNWDFWKIQGCKCDGDWTGTDCSQRICPWGDDPLTYVAPGSRQGTTYTILVTHNTSFTAADGADGRNGETRVLNMNLEIVDLHGTTHRSRVWNHKTDSATLDTISAAELEALLLDIPAIHDVDSVAITEPSAGVTVQYVFRLLAPLRLTDVRLSYRDECTVAGCYPMRAAMDPEDPDDQLISVAITSDTINSLLESAECSNRGTCDYSTGQCQCFEGHYGLACEKQTILV